MRWTSTLASCPVSRFPSDHAHHPNARDKDTRHPASNTIYPSKADDHNGQQPPRALHHPPNSNRSQNVVVVDWPGRRPRKGKLSDEGPKRGACWGGMMTVMTTWKLKGSRPSNALRAWFLAFMALLHGAALPLLFPAAFVFGEQNAPNAVYKREGASRFLIAGDLEFAFQCRPSFSVVYSQHRVGNAVGGTSVAVLF